MVDLEKYISLIQQGKTGEQEIQQLFEEYGIELNRPQLIETDKDSVLLEHKKRTKLIKGGKFNSTKHGRSKKQIKKDRKRKKKNR